MQENINIFPEGCHVTLKSLGTVDSIHKMLHAKLQLHTSMLTPTTLAVPPQHLRGITVPRYYLGTVRLFLLGAIAADAVDVHCNIHIVICHISTRTLTQ